MSGEIHFKESVVFITKPFIKGVSAVNLISVERLKAVVQQSAVLFVSIYMPVARSTEIKQNPIRFKNLIREAEDQIIEYGFDKKEAMELLEPVRAEAAIKFLLI